MMKNMNVVIIVVLVHVAVAVGLFWRGHTIAGAIVLAAGIIELIVGYNKFR